MSRERWLGRRRHRRGRVRRPHSCRAAARRASGLCRRRQAPSRARRTVESRDADLAVADRERARRHRGPSRPRRMRARQRRSVLLRRRRDADAPFRRGRDDLRPGAVRLCARGGAARLEPAGLRAALAARPPARSDHSASAPWRAHSGALLGRRHAGQAGGAAHGARHGTIEAHDLRGDGRPARAHSHERRRRLCARRTSPL